MQGEVHGSAEPYERAGKSWQVLASAGKCLQEQASRGESSTEGSEQKKRCANLFLFCAVLSYNNSATFSDRPAACPNGGRTGSPQLYKRAAVSEQ